MVNIGDKIQIKNTSGEWIITHATNYNGITKDITCYQMIDRIKQEAVYSHHYFVGEVCET